MLILLVEVSEYLISVTSGFIVHGQLSSQPNKVFDMECVHRPCVLLKYNTNTAEKHPHRLDETLVGVPERVKKEEDELLEVAHSTLSSPQSCCRRYEFGH